MVNRFMKKVLLITNKRQSTCYRCVHTLSYFVFKFRPLVKTYERKTYLQI